MKVAKSKNIKVSVVVVYFEGVKSLLNLLGSVKRNEVKTPCEVIVVNNNSSENVKPKIKRLGKTIKYIKSQGNIGYGRGNNLGAKQANGEYLLIVNPDVILQRNLISTLAMFLDKNEDAAIIAPNFTYTNGQLIEYIGSRTLTPLRGIFALSFINKLWPDNPISMSYYLRDINVNKLREVDVAPGTCFLIRKSVFNELGGFDPNFFLFFEETDLSKRVREKGGKIYITPRTSVAHDWKPGEGGRVLNQYYKASRFYYFKKHYGILSALIVELATSISKWHLVLLLILGILILLVTFG